MNTQAQANAAQQLAAAENISASAIENDLKLASQQAAEKKEEEEEDDDSPIDESGLEAKDIELVMAQVGSGRAT